MTSLEIINIFTWHPPHSDQLSRYDDLRGQFRDLALLIQRSCPESTEKELALRSLQQTLMWACAAIAINEKEDNIGNELSYQHRVMAERDELDEKLERLTYFISINKMFPTLPTSEQNLLIHQRDVMTQYLSVLTQRINKFVSPTSGQAGQAGRTGELQPNDTSKI